MTTHDENTAERRQDLSSLIIAIALIVVQLLVAAVGYAVLPQRMPVHWNAFGQIDRYGSKLEALLFPPLVSIVLLVLLRVLTVFGVYPARENRRVAMQFMNYILIAIIVLMQIVQLVIIAASLRVPIDPLTIIFVAVAVLFIGIGNYMGKLRRNGYAGIRTPWTMADDTVWERTHRLGGWLFVVAGIISLLSAFAPVAVLKVVGLLLPLLLVVVISTTYSYIEYQKVVVNRDRPRPL